MQKRLFRDGKPVPYGKFAKIGCITGGYRIRPYGISVFYTILRSINNSEFRINLSSEFIKWLL